MQVPRPELEPGRVEVAVDEDAGSGVGASEVGRGGEGPVAGGFGDAFSSVWVAASGFLDGGLVADEAAEVVEGGGVGDAGEDDLGSVVVDDGLGEGAVAGLDLGEVLPDGDELDADAAGGGGDLGEVGERGDVGGFVDHEEQWFGEPVGGPIGSVVDPGDGLFDQGGEEGSESGLFVEGSADVEGVAAAVEESVGVDGGLAGGGGEHAGVGEGGEDGFGGGVGGGAGAFFPVDGGGEGLEGVEFSAFWRARRGSSSSWRSTHRITSVMVAPERAAANRSGARSFWATAYQKSESWSPPRSPARAVEASQAAMRRAPCQSLAGVEG